MNHDLRRVVTVGKDIQKISTRHEEEPGERNFLGVHELIQSFLANSKAVLDLLKLWEHVGLSTERKCLLLLEAISQELLHININVLEFLRLVWQFFLYLFRVDEQVFQEGPGSIDLTNDQDDV